MFYCAKGTIINDQRSSPFVAGGLRGAISPPAGPGQSSGGGLGEKPLEDLENLHFKVPR